MSAPRSVLSPLAAPFKPATMTTECNFDGTNAIHFNQFPDSIESLREISDEAMDELFPPNFTDAMELEAVDAFVQIMAQLSAMEDAEENARHFEFTESASTSTKTTASPHELEGVDKQE